MSQQAADRNLLFGVLALQMDFITREQLIAAMQAWAFDKTKPLGEILLNRKHLAEDNRQLLEALVKKHLEMHDNNTEKSLSAISSMNDVKTDLLSIKDADVQASVGHISTGSKTELDPYATVAPTGFKPYDVSASSSAAPTSSGMRFRILRPHARGGLGEVSVARDQELNREVALKEILGRHADNLESRARFLLEAEITGGLEHPGIVPVYGLGTYGDGRPYYAMRFIRGDSLKDAVERFHMTDAAGLDPGQRALELRGLLGRFVDVCNAIHYAHNRGILHRDLKPGNIMLGKYGETLVVDWGLAKPVALKPGEEATERAEPGEGSLQPSSSTASETIAGSAVGTPQYMSPEQAAGRLDQLGPASDVYSLGATLYCLLTGKPPMTDKNVHDVIQKVQRGEFPKPREIKDSVPLPLEAVCLKAMSLKVENRYATARLLADDIEHWLADEPVTAWPEPWTVKARRWISRHTALVTGIASAVVIAVVGLVIATVLLTAANERERQAKQKAEENYQLARGAVKRYLSEVNDNDALKEPGMEPLKQKLLEAAREYNQEFVRLRHNDSTVKVEYAQATFQLGQITGELDSELDAIKLHEEAAKLLEALPADKAEKTKGDLAACYHHLGRLNRLVDRIAKSDEWYDKAIKAWKALVNDQPNEDRFRDGLARSQLGLGNLNQLLYKVEPAQKAYQQAIDAWDALHKANPNTTSYRRDLAVAHNNMGMTFKRAVGKKPEADKFFEAAEKLQTELVREAPKVIQYQNDLAKTEFNLDKYPNAAERWQGIVKRHPAVTEPNRTLAEVYTRLSGMNLGADPQKAEELSAKAVTLNRKLAERRPNVPSYQGDLGRGLTGLGKVHLQRGLFDKAEAELKEAVRIQDKLVGDLPGVLHYQRDLAHSYTDLGVALALNKKADKAADPYQKAAGIWDSLVKDHQDEQDFRVGYTITCIHLANLSSTTNKPADAVTWYTKALERAQEGTKPTLRLSRASELAKSGKYQEAAKEADDLAAKAETGSAKFRFAKVYSLCSAAALAAGQKADAEAHAERAVKLLNDAFDVIGFQTPANLKSLQADPDLRTLRERPDFKKLLSKLES